MSFIYGKIITYINHKDIIMLHYTGYYFCTKSNWDGKLFSANNLVSFEIENLNTRGFYLTKDALKILDKKEINNTILGIRGDCYYLKPEVYDWLIANVKDDQKGNKGWCCGNDEYNTRTYEFNLFFYRRKDTLKFIKEWGEYGKPTETYNQNTYVKKKLNLKTMKYEIIKR